MTHGLNSQQLSEILHILRPFAAEITAVGLFGSRATDRWRPESDIDLVLYGPISEASLNRLYSRMRESRLPVLVDLVAYERIEHPPLKTHIDQVMRLLFSAEDLTKPPLSFRA